MLKRCSNCKHCSVDLRAIMIASVWIMKCHLKDEHKLHPFFSGWRCADWGHKRRTKDGN